MDFFEQFEQFMLIRESICQEYDKKGDKEQFKSDNKELEKNIYNEISKICKSNGNIKDYTSKEIQKYCNYVVEDVFSVGDMYFDIDECLENGKAFSLKQNEEFFDLAQNRLEYSLKKIKSLVKQEKRNQKISDLKIKFIKFAKPKSKTKSNAQEKLGETQEKEQNK